MRPEEEGRLPFDEDAEAIDELLRDLNAPALLMALVRLTGDVGLIDGPFRPLRDRSGPMPCELFSIRLAVSLVSN